MTTRPAAQARLTVMVGLLLVAAPGLAAKTGGWVIPADQSATVFALLPPEGAALPPTEYRLAGIAIRGDTVEVLFTAPAGKQRVTLIHPSRAPGAAPRTRHFAVHTPAPTDVLMQAVIAHVGSRETASSPWRQAVTGTPPGAGRLVPVLMIGLGALVLVIVVLLLARRQRLARAP